MEAKIILFTGKVSAGKSYLINKFTSQKDLTETGAGHKTDHVIDLKFRSDSELEVKWDKMAKYESPESRPDIINPMYQGIILRDTPGTGSSSYNEEDHLRLIKLADLVYYLVNPDNWDDDDIRPAVLRNIITITERRKPLIIVISRCVNVGAEKMPSEKISEMKQSIKDSVKQWCCTDVDVIANDEEFIDSMEANCKGLSLKARISTMITDYFANCKYPPFSFYKERAKLSGPESKLDGLMEMIGGGVAITGMVIGAPILAPVLGAGTYKESWNIFVQSANKGYKKFTNVVDPNIEEMSELMQKYDKCYSGPNIHESVKVRKIGITKKGYDVIKKYMNCDEIVNYPGEHYNDYIWIEIMDQLYAVHARFNAREIKQIYAVHSAVACDD